MEREDLVFFCHALYNIRGQKLFSQFRVYAVMGTHSFIRYIVTVTVTLLVTTATNEHLQ
jgi:hypothetical protein